MRIGHLTSGDVVVVEERNVVVVRMAARQAMTLASLFAGGQAAAVARLTELLPPRTEAAPGDSAARSAGRRADQDRRSAD